MVVDGVRQALAVGASRTIGRAIRLSGRGGGTAFPGLVATRIDPDLLDKLAARMTSGIIVVAGTNGKTTTSRMLAGMLEAAGHSVIHNRSGSNLVRGIAGAFAEQMPIFGNAGVGVIESDENALPDVVRRSGPRMLVLLNLFRDQLDRYGELETVAALWRPVVAGLDPDTILVVNADDPNLTALAEAAPGPVVTFGLQVSGQELPALPHAADAAVCRRCGTRLEYEAIYISHLGAYVCPNCGNRRPMLDYAVTGAAIESIDRQKIVIRDQCREEDLSADLALPGLYNVYNAVAAVAAAREFGVPNEPVLATLSTFTPAFGRLERAGYEGLNLTLALAKNPVGFNEILRMIQQTQPAGTLVIAINDLDADGRDVSWLWDVDFEVLVDSEFGGKVITAGIRGHDMAVRMKYAGLDPARLDASVAGKRFDALFDHLKATSRPGERVFMLLTYTAMLELRRVLHERGAVEAFWDQ